MVDGPILEDDKQRCTVPPEGWFCTRVAGHEGPCAAWPVRKGYFARLWCGIRGHGGIHLVASCHGICKRCGDVVDCST